MVLALGINALSSLARGRPVHLVGAGGQEIRNSFQRLLSKYWDFIKAGQKIGNFPKTNYKDQDILDNSREVLSDKWHILLPL